MSTKISACYKIPKYRSSHYKGDCRGQGSNKGHWYMCTRFRQQLVNNKFISNSYVWERVGITVQVKLNCTYMEYG